MSIKEYYTKEEAEQKADELILPKEEILENLKNAFGQMLECVKESTREQAKYGDDQSDSDHYLNEIILMCFIGKNAFDRIGEINKKVE